MTDYPAILTAARQQLWREGRPGDYLLDEGQREWKAAFNATGPLASTVWCIGRQRGKTYDALTDACETALRIPGAILRYCAKTIESAMGIVGPNMAAIVGVAVKGDLLHEDCPVGCRPVLDGSTYRFPNGSALIVFGTDAQSFAKGRGPKSHKIYLDEVGFYQDLLAVESALLPSLQTTGGRALYLSSPPESMGHPYVMRIRSAMSSGNYRHDTFWSNPRVNHEAVIREEAIRLGVTLEQLLASTYFRREYLAQLVTEESRAAMPSWNQALHAQVVGEWTRPEHWDGYQGGDAGLTADPHAWLWAWHDPATNTLTIEDELELPSISNTIASLARDVKAKETALYGVNSWNGMLLGTDDWRRQFGELPEYLTKGVIDSAPRQPYLRIGDNAAGLCKEMSLQHGLAMLPTDKHDKALHVDAANQLLGSMRVRIHSRCVRLIEQLYTTVWNKARSEWERTAKDHGDLIDCLVYLLRNVRWHRDCRPKHVDAAEKHKAEVLRKVQPKAQGWNFGGRR